MNLVNITERIDSLKAGILGATTISFTFILMVIFNSFIFHKWLQDITILPLIRSEIKDIISIAMVLFSGFLFGVTYRYIMRRDQNFHLQSGAIIAFSLVRSLGQIELGFNILPTRFYLSGQWLILIVENILLFGVTAMSLDQGIQRGWIQSIGEHNNL